MQVDETHPSQDDVNDETETGSEDATENEEQASSENEEASEDATQEDNSDANENEADQETETTEEKTEPRKRNRVSDRIQQLNAQKKAAIDRADRAEKLLEQYKVTENDGADDYDEYDFNTIVERTARKTAELTQKQNVEAAKHEVQQFETQELNAKIDAFQEAEEAFMAKVPDYDEAVSQIGFIAENSAVTGLLLESEKGAELTYYLAKNPKEAHAVAQMPPLQAAKYLGGVEAKLTAPTPKTATTAPKPVPKISGKSGSQSKDPSTMTMVEYEKWRTG